MSYARPADRTGALRLHLNENTGGCSQAVIDAIRSISAEDTAYYPEYASLSRECAAYLGVGEAQLVLTNGLDEGLLALTVSAFSTMHGIQGLPEAIIPMPAFEMYSVFVKAAGGRVVPIPPGPDFAFQDEAVCNAVTERTRIVFLTNPNNPTGQLIPRDALREIVRRVPQSVTIVIDEAYYDF
jgi:histidinol-phosphate aminotransferase